MRVQALGLELERVLAPERAPEQALEQALERALERELERAPEWVQALLRLLKKTKMFFA